MVQQEIFLPALPVYHLLYNLHQYSFSKMFLHLLHFFVAAFCFKSYIFIIDILRAKNSFNFKTAYCIKCIDFSFSFCN